MGLKIWWPILFTLAIVAACILIFPSDLRLADLLGHAGRYDKAIAEYRTILAREPLRSDARIELSRLYLVNEQPEQAVAEIEKVGLDSLRDPIFVSQIADIYAKLEEKEKTVDALERLVDLQPGSWRHRQRLAEAYEWSGQKGQAVYLYEKLLQERPNNIGILDQLAQLHLQQDQLAAAAVYLSRITDLKPEQVASHTQLAQVLIDMGEKEQAATELEQVLNIEPDNELVRQKLAEVYLWMQDVDRAIAHYEILVRRHPNNDAYFERFTDVAYDFAPHKSVPIYHRKLEAHPQDTELRKNLIGLYLHLGEPVSAIPHLKWFISHKPNEPQYYAALANVYQDMREPRLASQVRQAMLDNGMFEQDVAQQLVIYYRREKQYDALFQVYDQLLDEGVESAETRREYADLLAQVGRYDAAIRQYQKVVRHRPQDSEARIQLSMLYLHKNDRQKALATLKQGFAAPNAQSERFWLYSGSLFSQQGFREESVAAFENLVTRAPNNLHYKTLLAEQYVLAGEIQPAMRIYDDLLARDPNSVDLKLKLASLYWKQDDLKSMRDLLARIDAGSDTEDMDSALAEFYFERGFFEQSVRHDLEILQKSPEDSVSLRRLGLAYAWNNNPAKAKEILTTYHRLYPNDYYTHFHLGELHLLESDHGEARTEFETALNLLASVPRNKEARVVAATIYAHLGQRERAIRQFEDLRRQFPQDLSLAVDYSESLLNLKEYEQSGRLLAQVLEQDPTHYRALRLQSRSYFERGRYRQAANTLRELQEMYRGNIGLSLDLADAQLAAGDWYGSTETLERVISSAPDNLPAHRRLTLLRRDQAEQVSARYRTSEQTDNFVKRAADFVISKAKSSLLHFRMLFSREQYADNRDRSLDTEYTSVEASLTSSFGAKLSSQIGMTTRSDGDNWYLSANATAQWKFTPEDNVIVTGEMNELWDDPFSAALFNGKRHSLQSDLNLTLARRLYLWNRLKYERHLLDNQAFGEAARIFLQTGWRWRLAPEIATYYQFYHLRYRYLESGDPALVSIPERDAVHAVGSSIRHQLHPHLFYRMNGSVGWNPELDALTYYGTIGLEISLLSRLRLSSLFEYGSQNRLTGNDRSSSLMFDFSYFY